MDHPLVGKTITIRYETPAAAQGASFQWHFLSNSQKHAHGLGTAAGYDALHTYDIAIVAPNTYFLAWLKDDGDAVAVVLNLDDRTVYASATSPTPARFFLLGVIDHIADAEDTHDQ